MPRSKIELRHVRYIIAAAESGSFRRAAQDLGVEQSAISRRIRDVEDEIGAQLFRRHPAGVDLTDIGKQFLNQAAPGARQIGSALGTAFAGGTLSVALALTLPAALNAAGLTGDAADELAAATRQSAGTTITQLRAGVDAGSFGDQGAAAADALAAGFADATRWSLLVASVFLLLGLVGAARLRRAATAEDADITA